jgi:mono/diheme cytochrome c family protein
LNKQKPESYDMRTLPQILLTGFFVICAAIQAPAQDYGDAAVGLAYAKKVCATCHTIGKGEGASLNLEAPSFEEIARTPGVTTMALSAMLLTSHKKMPNFVIATEDRANVIAYILSLKN